MGRSIQLGRIFGIPFRLDYSWFLIFILVTTLLALYILPVEWSTAARWGIGVITSILFFASVLAHELSHSLVGMRAGIPVKSITLFFFGGVAHIGREASDPGTELRMAAAGPLCSLALAGIFFGISFATRNVNEYVSILTLWLAWINGILAAFNLIPGFPLDGGRVLRAIVWKISGNYMRASRVATSGGYITSYLFIAGGIFLLFFSDYFFNGLWFIFLGFFLNGATRNSYRQTELREALKGLTAGQVMSRDLPRIPRQTTIGELVRGPLLTATSPCFLIMDGDRLDGVLTMRQLRAVPRAQWELTTAAQAMTPAEGLRAVRPGDAALSILERMDEEGIDVVAVASGGQPTGIVLRDELIRFAMRLGELKA